MGFLKKKFFDNKKILEKKNMAQPQPPQKNLVEGLSEQQTIEFYKVKINEAYQLFKDTRKNYVEKE